MNVNILIGKTLIEINNHDSELEFNTNDGEQYLMYHSQDCCEHVSIEDIIGDLKDLLNSPILLAEEVTSDKNPDDIKKQFQDCYTWTFYKFSTIKGSVTIRWYGESNGYYSESVDFMKVK